MYYQLEVTLSHIHGNSFTRLAQYAGIYTLTSEKKNDRYVWVKKSGSGGHAIWRKAGGWRIGSISEKERNTDNTAFKSDGFGKNPTDEGQWQYRVRNTIYRNDNGIINHLDLATDKNKRDILFDGRRSLQEHVANFKTAFKGLVDGTDKVATCIKTYNDYAGRPTNSYGGSYNCGDPLIGEPGTPCGGNGVSNIISMNNVGWFATQLTNLAPKSAVKAILFNWISVNTPGGQPNSRNGKVQLTTSGHGTNMGGSLNTMDRQRTGYDLKAHFTFKGIRA